MSVQVTSNITNYPFILCGKSFSRNGLVLEQDGGRTTPLAFGTVLESVNSGGAEKLRPLAGIVGNTTTYIYLGSEIAAADIVAGEVTIYNLLVGGCCAVDETQVVLEGSLTLDSALSTGLTVRQTLFNTGIFAELSDNIDFFEN